jgi:hypothetical protein
MPVAYALTFNLLGTRMACNAPFLTVNIAMKRFTLGAEPEEIKNDRLCKLY